MTSLEEKYGLQEECDEALRTKNNYPFQDLCRLAESAGFVLRKQSGSHKIYKHPQYISSFISDRINLQPNKSNQAKPYQIKQVVNFIREAEPKQ